MLPRYSQAHIASRLDYLARLLPHVTARRAQLVPSLISSYARDDCFLARVATSISGYPLAGVGRHDDVGGTASTCTKGHGCGRLATNAAKGMVYKDTDA